MNVIPCLTSNSTSGSAQVEDSFPAIKQEVSGDL